MWGVLNCYKEAGITSRDVVNRVQRCVRPAKAGHGGTLDPLATGVLVICVGAATRLLPFIHQYRKRYRAEFLLGFRSDTDDTDGRVERLESCRRPDRDVLQNALARFVGVIEQTPPAYSAVKVAGKRAYALARRGRPVDLPARTVQAYSLEMVSYNYPKLVIDICCGSGFYVRALGRDLARAVGSAAVMSALERQAVGPFTAADAVRIHELGRATVATWLQPALAAVAHLPRHQLHPDQLRELATGALLQIDEPEQGDEIAAITPGGELAAILKRHGEHYRPWRNFAATQAAR